MIGEMMRSNRWSLCPTGFIIEHSGNCHLEVVVVKYHQGF